MSGLLGVGLVAGNLFTEHEAAEYLGDLKTRAWDALRASNEGTAHRRAYVDAANALEAAERDFRAAFYPRAGSIWAVCDRTIGQELEVFTVSPKGRSVRLVYPENGRRK